MNFINNQINRITVRPFNAFPLHEPKIILFFFSFPISGQHLRRSPRSSIKTTSSTSATTTTLATAAPWDGSGYHHSSLLVAVGASTTDTNKAPSASASAAHVTNFFSSSALDTALSMSFQPSTSQTAPNNPSVPLAPNDASAATKVKTNINTAASTSAENDNIANSNLARGLGASGFRNSNATGNAVPTALTSADTDADDPDVGRLQALLEARGIPPQVFGSLGESTFCLFFSYWVSMGKSIQVSE